MKTIYLPDDLAEAVRARPERNISAICQAAPWRVIEQEKRMEELAKNGVQRIEIRDDHGFDRAFTGRWITEENRGGRSRRRGAHR